MTRLLWLTLSLCSCAGTAPLSAPLSATHAPPRAVLGQAAAAAEHDQAPIPVATLNQQLASLLQPPDLTDNGQGWLDGRTTLRPLAPGCWKLEQLPATGEHGTRVQVLQHHGSGPNDLACGSGPTALSEVAEFFVAHSGASLEWRSTSGSTTFADFLAERRRGLLRAVALLRARLEEAGVAWDDSVRFRVDGEANSFVDVTVADVGHGRDIATFRVARGTGEVAFISADAHGAEIQDLEAFERQWFAAHPPAVTALNQALDLDWTSCRDFRVEAEHGNYFDVEATLSDECAEGGPKDPQHFRVDLRSGLLTWKHQQRYVPLTELHRRMADLSARATKIFKRWLANNPHYRQLECPGVLPSGVSGSNVSIRLHVAPPCNESPMLMTMGWFTVNVDSGRVSCDGPCP